MGKFKKVVRDKKWIGFMFYLPEKKKGTRNSVISLPGTLQNPEHGDFNYGDIL